MIGEYDHLPLSTISLNSTKKNDHMLNKIIIHFKLILGCILVIISFKNVSFIESQLLECIVDVMPRQFSSSDSILHHSAKKDAISVS